MTPTDLLTFDGTTQPISEWALDYGIPAELIIERLAEGQTAEAAITTMMPFDATPVKRGPRARLYTHDGMGLTISEWSERSGVSHSTLAQRLARGMSIGEALNPDLNKKNVTYTHAGETKTLGEWAESSGINYTTLRHRVVRNGLSIGEAISRRTYEKHGARLYTHEGLSLTITEWAQRIGIPRSTLAKRIESGIPISKAVNPVLEKRVTRYLHNGEERTLTEWAAVSGIKYETLHNRVTAQGLSLGEALNKRKSSKPGAHDELHTHNGETKTFAEWASSAGIAYRTLRERMTKCGLSLNEALAMPKSGKMHRAAVRPASGSANVSITIAGVRIVIEAAGPGVVFNFEGLKGTGAGSTAQEIPEITFSAEAITE